MNINGMSALPALSAAARLARIAYGLGYRGEGSLTLPVIRPSGTEERAYIIVSDTYVPTKAGLVVLRYSERTFYVSAGEEGSITMSPLPSELAFEEALEASPDHAAPQFAPIPVPQPDPEPQPEPIEPGDTSILVDPVYSTDAQAAQVFLAPNGRLIHGTGNRSENMVTASNGEIAMCGAVRWHRDPTIISNTDGKFSLVASENPSSSGSKDWTIVFGVALADTRNGEVLTDLYDVTLDIVNTDRNSALNLTAHYVAPSDMMLLADDRIGLEITDNDTGGNGHLLMNIQRVTFYAQQLSAVKGQSSKVPVGNYEFTLTAKRRAGNAPDVVLSWSAAVEDVRSEDLSAITAPTELTIDSLGAMSLVEGKTRYGNLSPEDFVVTNNGEFMLALAPRLRHANSPLPEVDLDNESFVYSLNANDSMDYPNLRDWGIFLMVGLLNKQSGVERLADAYEFGVTIDNLDNGMSHTATLSPIETDDGMVYPIISGGSTMDVRRGLIYEDQDQMQSFQTLDYYAAHLDPTPAPNTTGAFIGNFMVTAFARRLRGDVPELSARFRVEVTDNLYDVDVTTEVTGAAQVAGLGSLGNDGMVYANNGEVAVSMAVRVGSQSYVTASGEAFLVNVDGEQKDFRYDFGIEVLNQTNFGERHAVLADLYSAVVRIVYGDTVLEAPLDFDVNLGEWSNSEYGIRLQAVTDGKYAGNVSVREIADKVPELVGVEEFEELYFDLTLSRLRPAEHMHVAAAALSYLSAVETVEPEPEPQPETDPETDPEPQP